MKKAIAFIIILMIFSSLTIYAESEIPETDSSDSIVIPQSQCCICGRNIYTEEIDGHSPYDCEKCGKNMYSCTCNCWCGSEKTEISEGVTVCSACGHVCNFCTCRDDRTAVISAEKQVSSGNISSIRTFSPKTGFISVFAVISVFAATALMFFFSEKTLKGKPKKVKETKVGKTEKSKNTVKKSDGGAFVLYDTVSKLYFGIKGTKHGISLPDADFTVSRDEADILFHIANVQPNALCPIKTAEYDDLKAIVKNLEKDEIIGKNGGNYALFSPYDEYVHDIAEPDSRFTITLSSCGIKADICGKDGNWYIIIHNGFTENIFTFKNTDGVISFINNRLLPEKVEAKQSKRSDISMSYPKFALMCHAQLIAVRDGKDGFSEESLGSPALIGTISASLSSNPIFAEIYSSLKNGDTCRELCESLKNDGFLVPYKDGFTFSEYADRTVSLRELEEAVTLTYTKGKLKYQMLFAVRKNDVCMIYDNGECVRIVSSDKIPWKTYLGK